MGASLVSSPDVVVGWRWLHFEDALVYQENLKGGMTPARRCSSLAPDSSTKAITFDDFWRHGGQRR